MMGDFHQLVVEKLTTVGRNNDLGTLFGRQIGYDVAGNILRAFMDKTKSARGEIGVAALFGLGRAFEHQNTRAVLMRGNRGTERSVAGAGYNHVVFSHGEILSFSARTVFHTASSDKCLQLSVQ